MLRIRVLLPVYPHSTELSYKEILAKNFKVVELIPKEALIGTVSSVADSSLFLYRDEKSYEEVSVRIVHLLGGESYYTDLSLDEINTLLDSPASPDL